MKVQPRVVTAKCSEPQAGTGNGVSEGSGVVILKQWKKPRTIYRNLMKLNKYIHANLSDESIFKVANSRLGWYRRCGGDVVNYLLSPKVLAIAQKDRPGLVDPLAYYLSRMQ